MNYIKFRDPARAGLIIITILTIFQSCKKGSAVADPGPPAEYYLSAQVDGKSWSANLKNGSNDVAAGTSGGFMFVLGVQVNGKDSTAIILAFPAHPQLNTMKAFDPLQKSVAGYITSAAQYSADPAVNGSGNYVITSINDSSKVIEGTFTYKGMRTSGSGAASVSVTDGKFKTIYRDNFSPQPPDNLKR